MAVARERDEKSERRETSGRSFIVGDEGRGGLESKECVDGPLLSVRRGERGREEE